VLGLPTLGVVGFGFGLPCWCGVGGPRPGVSALLASLVRALGKYLDPVKKGSVWPSVYMGVLKFPGTVPVACRRKGSRVT